MARKLSLIALLAVLSISIAVPAAFATRGGEGGRGDGPIIYVTSQGLYYDSIVTADSLPQQGPFQELENTPAGLQTEFGPGDRDYVGGRWWVDTNGNGEMDEADAYFACPLLGPGRSTP